MAANELKFLESDLLAMGAFFVRVSIAAEAAQIASRNVTCADNLVDTGFVNGMAQKFATAVKAAELGYAEAHRFFVEAGYAEDLFAEMMDAFRLVMLVERLNNGEETSDSIKGAWAHYFPNEPIPDDPHKIISALTNKRNELCLNIASTYFGAEDVKKQLEKLPNEPVNYFDQAMELACGAIITLGLFLRVYGVENSDFRAQAKTRLGFVVTALTHLNDKDTYDETNGAQFARKVFGDLLPHEGTSDQVKHIEQSCYNKNHHGNGWEMHGNRGTIGIAPGDVIFYGYKKENGNYTWSHVRIYIGNGKTIESTDATYYINGEKITANGVHVRSIDIPVTHKIDGGQTENAGVYGYASPPGTH